MQDKITVDHDEIHLMYGLFGGQRDICIAPLSRYNLIGRSIANSQCCNQHLQGVKETARTNLFDSYLIHAMSFGFHCVIRSTMHSPSNKMK